MLVVTVALPHAESERPSTPHLSARSGRNRRDMRAVEDLLLDAVQVADVTAALADVNIGHPADQPRDRYTDGWSEELEIETAWSTIDLSWVNGKIPAEWIGVKRLAELLARIGSDALRGVPHDRSSETDSDGTFADDIPL